MAVIQDVTLDVDAFPNHVFRGTVGSLSPDTGAQFAILPPQNATGNFVKVVQRVRCRSISIRPTSRPQAERLRHERLCHDRRLPSPLARQTCSALAGGRQTKDRRLISTPAAAPATVPSLRRNMVTICAMTATPSCRRWTPPSPTSPYRYCRSSLSASQDQINWVLTVLHRRRRDHDRAGGLDRQPLRPQAHLHHLLRRLHLRLRAVRPGAGHQPDGAVPSAAGRVRRGPGAAVAIGHARLLHAAGTRQGDVDLGHGRDDGPDHGPLARRLADRDLFLALGVLRQPAVRRHHRARPDRLHGRDPEGYQPQIRLVRLRRAGGRDRLAAARARPRRAVGLARDPTRSSPNSSSRPSPSTSSSRTPSRRRRRSSASRCSRIATSSPAACSWS